MRIKRNFLSGNETRCVEETILSGSLKDCGKVVAFRGDVWQWEFYDEGVPPIDYELYYTKVNPNKYHDYVVTEIIGRLLPKKVNCDCGSSAVGSKKHSWYCSTETVDPWKED